MAQARSKVVREGEVHFYHCVSRCVRRAFLCGQDPYKGTSYEHRKDWVRTRLFSLRSVFAIEIGAYAVMSNHLHTLLRTRPDVAAEWSAEEVALRWRKLFPRGRKGAPGPHEIKEIVEDEERVELYRARLSCISWFQRCLNEVIARRANKEDEVTGRFWEGRFSCTRVDEPGGVLACAVYIDLNPIRAGVARTPEESDYTSIRDRLDAYMRSPKQGLLPSRANLLLPVVEMSSGYCNEQGYLELVDSSGRTLREGKGAIPEHLRPLLERMRLNPSGWMSACRSLGQMFKKVIGSKSTLVEAAKSMDQAWLYGASAAKIVFS